MKWLLTVAVLWSGGPGNAPFVEQDTFEVTEDQCLAHETVEGSEAWRLRILKKLDAETIEQIGVPVALVANCVLGVDV